MPNETLKKISQVHQVTKEQFPLGHEKLSMNLHLEVKKVNGYVWIVDTLNRATKLKVVMNYLFHHDNIIIKCINTK